MRLAGLLAAIAATTLLVGSAGARPDAVTTTWKLVQRACKASEKRVGLACWDPQGRTDWEVGASSATRTVTYGDRGFDLTYRYTIPSTIPPGGERVQLGVTVTSRDPAGVSGQVCVETGFYASGDKCARASVPRKDGSNSGSATVELKGIQAQTGTRADLRVALGDGGDLYHTYEAQTPKPGATPQPRKQLDVEFVFREGFKGFRPTLGTLASGGRVRICNGSSVFVKVFSYSATAKHSTLVRVQRGNRVEQWRLPGAGRESLKPGACDSFTVRNPTGAPFQLKLFDEIHATAKLTLTVAPAR